MQGWRFFKNDTKYFVNQQQLGNNPTNNTVIDTYERNVPTRGDLPYTKVQPTHLSLEAAGLHRAVRLFEGP